MGNAQEYCAIDLGECKVNSIGGGKLIYAKRMDGKLSAESALLRLKVDKCERDQSNPKVDKGCVAGSICQRKKIYEMV